MSLLFVGIKRLSTKNSAEEASRQWAICVYDDLIEFGGPAAWAYNNRFGQLMIKGLSDASADVRQASAYGIGVCAQFGGDNFNAMCQGMFLRVVSASSFSQRRSLFCLG